MHLSPLIEENRRMHECRYDPDINSSCYFCVLSIYDLPGQEYCMSTCYSLLCCIVNIHTFCINCQCGTLLMTSSLQYALVQGSLCVVLTRDKSSTLFVSRFSPYIATAPIGVILIITDNSILQIV